MHLKLVASTVLIACCTPGFAQETDATAVEQAGRLLFERLKAFEGEWRIAQPARDTKVTFEVIAGGSAIVEKWQMSPTRSSMTVYTMDGDRLTFTHYCPQGNAPRLVLSDIDKDGMHQFKFLDGFNLQDPTRSHQHVCSMRIDSDSSFTRSEVYIKNGDKYDASKHEDSPQTFVRVNKE